MDNPDQSQKPLPRHAAARIVHAQAACQLSDYAAAVVPTVSDKLADPGEFITQARQARKLALALLQRAVLLERALGRSWKQIAHAFGYTEEWVRAEYEPLEAEWVAARQGTHLHHQERLVSPIDFSQDVLDEPAIRQTAEDLDDWCDQPRIPEHHSPNSRRRLVSDGLVS